mmetsp:Transcript_10793/g.34423  ORF Transcript_10793/g.34423 Transcript_10793/m.34423 type:complete len:214 (+) Transcript_10793:2276-2917(+)
MAPHSLPSLESEDLVVHGLTRDHTARWVVPNDRHGLHAGVLDVLYWHWDVHFPCQHLLVIRGRKEPAILVKKRDGVDCREMMGVSLHYASLSRIYLQHSAVCARKEHDIVVLRIERHGVCWRRQTEGRFGNACLDIPEQDTLIVAARREGRAIVVEGDSADGSMVSGVGALGTATVAASARVVDAKNLARGVQAATQEQMGVLWEPLDLLHAL